MTRRGLCLHLLREAGERGVTTAELLQAGVGSRYSARILELRTEGYVIESERIREGSWRYVLTHDAERAAGPPATDRNSASRSPGAMGRPGPGVLDSPRAESSGGPDAGVGGAGKTIERGLSALHEDYRGSPFDPGAAPPTPAAGSPHPPPPTAGSLFELPPEKPRDAALHDWDEEAA